MTGRRIYHSWGTDDNDPIAGPTPALQTTTPRDGVGGGTRDPINTGFLTEIRDVIANRMADATGLAGTRFRVVQSADLGAFSGASDDFAMSRNLPTVPGGRQPIRSFTIECGRTFIDDFTTDFPATEREVQAALISLLVHASSPLGLAAAQPVPSTPSTRPPRSCTNCTIGVAGGPPPGSET